MLADYYLFYDPESNRLFIPKYDTEPVDPDVDDSTSFDVLTYKPVSSLGEYELPHFRAVKLCSFGTWGLVRLTRSDIIKQISEEKPYKSEALNDAFSEFRTKFPNFAKVKFAKNNEIGVPESAVINI